MEDVPPSAVSEIALPKESEAEKSALAAAEEEVRRLRVELRGREADLAEAREECRNLRGRMESDRAELDRERDDFRAASAKEAAALKEASRIEGYEEGHSKGYPEGLAKADADMKEEYEGKFSRALALLDGMAQSLADARERLAMSHASQLIRLWETMLRKMLATVVAIDPQVVERVVGILLKRLSDRERIIVCLNPDDVAMIEESKEKLMDSIRGVKFFELISDDHVDKGSCLIETNLGIYDARWRTQLEQVSSEVENLLTESMATTDGPGPSEPAQH
jgi:flagellar assembly protein FliH